MMKHETDVNIFEGRIVVSVRRPNINSDIN